MKSCNGKSSGKRPVNKVERPAAGPFSAAETNTSAFSVSATALAVALLAAAPSISRAAWECGADGAGQDTLTCSGASYATGISYAGSNGLTLNLANPSMVVSGTQGVSLQAPPAVPSLNLTVNVTDIQSITATGSAVTVTNSAVGGLASVNIGSGTLTSTGATNTVSAHGGSAGASAQVTLTGGQVLNTGTGGGIVASTASVAGTGNATVVMTGGTVQASGTGVTSSISGTNHTGTASITMSGGSVLSTGATGLWARHTGKGLAQVQMSGGTVAATGTNSDGVFASSNTGTYAVDVSGGTVTGGGGFGAAIHTSAAAGGIVNIGTGAVINAGSSGVAIRDGDFNRDGIDEIGGNATITIAGTLNGAVLLGGGTDTLNVTGGAINGNITGDGVDALNFNLGSNSFVHGGAYAISGMDAIVMNSGLAQIDSTISANTITVKGGTIVLNGNSAASAGTTVEAGTLAVNGTLGGTLNVLAPGRLQGSGSVGSTTIAGTVAPGNSIGILSVNGNFAQLAGSTYQVEVDPASTASDLIRVSGSASIGTGSRLEVVRAGAVSYSVGTRYTVLSADGGVAGTYSLAGNTQSAFARLIDSYDANHVYLTAEKLRDITDAAETPNEGAVGGALDSLPGSNGFANEVTWLPNDSAARDALNQLSADIHASTKTALLEDSRFVREAAIDRLRGSACAPGSAAASPAQTPQQMRAGCTPEDLQKHSAWIHVFGSWGSIDSDGNAAKLKRDIGGFLVGADTGVGAGWRVGMLGGYSRASADTSARNSGSKTDSYHLGAYGGTQWDATALRLGASHSWNKTETNRSVAFAGFAGGLNAEYDSTTTQVFGELGHQIDMGRAVLEPFSGLAHVRLKSDAFLERGGPAAMYGEGDSTNATFSTIGLRASMQAGESTRLRGMLGWRHAFGDTAPTSTHTFSGSLPFTLAGVPLAKNVAAFDAGIETQLRPNLTLEASYSGQFGDGLEDHGFKASLNWKF
ncbi:autotransporter outer membrane beta-barrel domain-containing protein [Noviherbaspirillum cavernae]|uniref:Autotransporter outer membrane beta-barrel domain-containing protein n=2 Tax=Noviherbaspirillum cavernae TaxID=2320862 RepID=A0A418WZK4_9BURK|nr:autotransporter outer membrane beta-barrel domain-containing protein [Noviherbaspirillum cavernae]